LPATTVGAIDIHQRHTLADVAAEHAEFIIKKLTGIKVKGIPLEAALASTKQIEAE
jgi:ATP-dependent RNA helicase DeaD